VQEDGHGARILTLGEGHDALADALECEVGRCVSDGEATDCPLIDPDRQSRPIDMNLAAPSVHAQAKTGLQYHAVS
jgi:hypothetical protein